MVDDCACCNACMVSRQQMFCWPEEIAGDANYVAVSLRDCVIKSFYLKKSQILNMSVVPVALAPVMVAQ
jgi:hypothetical protein